MYQYFITFENSEDMFDGADNLQDAIRIAREVAKQGPIGEPVCIEHKGLHIRQYLLAADGKVAEEVLVGERLAE